MQIKLQTDDKAFQADVEQFEGTESISGLFRYRLDVLVLPEGAKPFEQIIGKNVTIEFKTDDVPPIRYWRGIIRRVRKGGEKVFRSGRRFLRYRLVVVPGPWLLTQAVQSRIFQGLSAVGVLKEVFQGHDVVYPQDDFPGREYCVQYGETDFDFASRLMEDEGIFCFFNQSQNQQEPRHTLVLGHAMDVFPAVAGPVDWKLQQAIVEKPPWNAILSWRKSQAITPAAWALRDYQAAIADRALNTQKPILDSVIVGGETHKLVYGSNQGLEVYEHPGGVRIVGHDFENFFKQQERRAGLRAQETAAGSLRIDGESTCCHFQAGQVLTASAEGKFVLTRVKHHAVMDVGYLDDQAATTSLYSNSFRGSPFTLPYRPARRTPKPHAFGPLTAVVMGDVEEVTIKDKDGKEVKDRDGKPVKEFMVSAKQEVVVDEHGRIKVQFHWDRQGVPALKVEGQELAPDAERPTFKYWPRREGGKKPSECWVRFAQPLAGRGWGHIAIPRVGQEVLVGFLNGDPDRPVVLGSLYNSANVPPFRHAGHIQSLASGWKSHSAHTKFEDDAFNGIAFNDTKDREIAYLQAQRNLILNAKKHMVTNVGGNHYENIAGHKLKLTGSLPGFGEATPGKDDHQPAPHSSSGGDGHHGDFEGVSEHLWQIGPIEAKLAKEIEISYGVEMGAHLGLKLEALFGGKTEFTISPSMLASELPFGPVFKKVLAAVLGTADGKNDYHMGPKFGFHLGAESETKLASEIHVNVGQGTTEYKILKTLGIVAVVLAMGDAVALGFAAKRGSEGHELSEAELKSMLALTSALGIALACLAIAQLVVRIKAAAQGAAHHGAEAAHAENAPVLAAHAHAVEEFVEDQPGLLA